MKYKRYLFALAMALLMLAVVGCGSTGNSSAANTSSASSSAAGASDYDYSKGLSDKGFYEGVKASDIVTLPEYKGITISKDVTTASDEDVKSQVDSILSNYTTYDHITDRAIQDGDTVNIDYVGKVDGKEFDKGSTNGAGTDVTIGVTSYIDDFIDQLVGHKPGETFDVNVTFPEDYGVDTLNGKDAVFSTTINYIQGEAHVPELSDEIAKDYDFESADAMVADIRSWIIEQQKTDYVKNLLADATCDEIPATVITYAEDTDLAQYKSYAASNGTDLDTMFTSFGYDSAAAYLEAQQDTYKEESLFALAIQAIAEKENLTVSDDQLKEYGYADYQSTYGAPYLRMYALQTNVVPDFIFENATIA